MSADVALQRPYYAGLNGLRFFAASSVVIYHGELVKMKLGLSNILWANPFIANIGQMAVNFFFVLSGFLITTLLYHESKSSGVISIKKFYWRRVLRIWPPYYTCLIICFFVLPHVSIYKDFSEHPSHHPFIAFLLYLFLLPNFVPLFSGTQFWVNHLWSIGVEEQFYFVWPWLIKFFKKSIVPILGVIMVFVLARVILRTTLYLDFLEPEQVSAWNRFISSIRIHCMAIGALGAWAIDKKKSVIETIFTFQFQFFTYALTVYLLVSNFKLSTINDELYCILFLIIIINVANNPKSVIKLSWTGFKLLGNLSYGLYVYHMIAIFGVCKLWIQVDDRATLYNILIQHILFLSATLLLAYISYIAIERRLLRLKYSI